MESYASQRHVSYSCGSCGYELNLSSSNRNTTTIGSKYSKSIKRGVISFFQIDDSRFMKVDEIKCTPYFISKHSWGLFRRRTKLLCCKCGHHIGNALDDKSYPFPLLTDGSTLTSPVGQPATQTRFDVRIRSLQPLCTDQVGTPLVF